MRNRNGGNHETLSRRKPGGLEKDKGPNGAMTPSEKDIGVLEAWGRNQRNG